MTKLPDTAFRDPLRFRRVYDTKTYRDIMLTEQGQILAAGHFWNIKGKNLGAGLWEVTLTRAV